jgi:hypothetical protein
MTGRRRKIENGKDGNDFLRFQVPYKPEGMTVPNIGRLPLSHWGI